MFFASTHSHGWDLARAQHVRARASRDGPPAMVHMHSHKPLVTVKVARLEWAKVTLKFGWWEMLKISQNHITLKFVLKWSFTPQILSMGSGPKHDQHVQTVSVGREKKRQASTAPPSKRSWSKASSASSASAISASAIRDDRFARWRFLTRPCSCKEHRLKAGGLWV